MKLGMFFMTLATLVCLSCFAFTVLTSTDPFLAGYWLGATLFLWIGFGYGYETRRQKVDDEARQAKDVQKTL